MLIPNEIQTAMHDKFEELYSILQQYCLSITQDVWDANDLTQETIAKTLSFYAKKQEQNINMPLLRTIARNQWIDELRKKSKLTTSLMNEPSYEDQNLDDLLDGLDHLMERLTPKQLLAFVMKESFLYPSSEISRRLRITEMAVKSLLYRARHKSDHCEGNFSAQWQGIQQDWFKSQLLYAVKFEEPAILEQLIIAVTTAGQKPNHQASSTPVCTLLPFNSSSTPHMIAA